MEPIGKASPGLRVLDRESWAPELSVAVGRVQVATAVVAPWAAVMATPEEGQPEMMGGVVSPGVESIGG